MAIAGTELDPYANVRKRAASQLAVEAPAPIDAPAPDPVTSPDFKAPVQPSGNPTTYAPWTGPTTVQPSGINPPPLPLGDPKQPAPLVGPAPTPVTYGDPNPLPEAPLPLGNPENPPPYAPPPRSAVPGMNYSQAGTTSEQPVSTAPTVAKTEMPTSTQQNSAGAGGDEAAVAAFYQKYLGRDALPDDAQKWLSGAYGHGTDLATIENAIRNSPEAQAYAAAHGGAPSGNYDGNPEAWMGLVGNPSSLLSWVKQQNPSLTDAEAQYYAGKIQQQPGQNATEQAGGAAYWGDLIRRKAGGDSGSPAGRPGAAPPAPYTPPSTGPIAPTGTSPYQDEIRKRIMERLKEAGAPVDQNAAGITDAVSAARDETTRAGEQERTALAERLYAQGGGGLNTNALTQQIQQSGERTAQTTSGMRATLIMQEYGRKQQELDQLLSMATASGDAESARNIQIYMAQLQAQLQREGISADLAKYAAYLNQNTALAGLNG